MARIFFHDMRILSGVEDSPKTAKAVLLPLLRKELSCLLTNCSPVGPAAFDLQSQAERNEPVVIRMKFTREGRKKVSENPPKMGLRIRFAPRWGSHHSPQWDSVATRT